MEFEHDRDTPLVPGIEGRQFIFLEKSHINSLRGTNGGRLRGFNLKHGKIELSPECGFPANGVENSKQASGGSANPGFFFEFTSGGLGKRFTNVHQSARNRPPF